VEVLASGDSITAPMDDTYDKLGIDPSSVTTLDSYLAEYYQSILKKLKEVGAEVRRPALHESDPPQMSQTVH
jgi:hypothetical protein